MNASVPAFTKGENLQNIQFSCIYMYMYLVYELHGKGGKGRERGGGRGGEGERGGEREGGERERGGRENTLTC